MSRHGHVRGAEEPSAGLLLTPQLPTVLKKKNNGQRQRQSIAVKRESQETSWMSEEQKSRPTVTGGSTTKSWRT